MAGLCKGIENILRNQFLVLKVNFSFVFCCLWGHFNYYFWNDPRISYGGLNPYTFHGDLPDPCIPCRDFMWAMYFLWSFNPPVFATVFFLSNGGLMIWWAPTLVEAWYDLCHRLHAKSCSVNNLLFHVIPMSTNLCYTCFNFFKIWNSPIFRQIREDVCWHLKAF